MEKRGEVATLLLLISAGVVLLGAALGIKDAATPQPNPLNSTAQQSSCTFKSTATLKNESGNVLPITTNGNDITIHYKLTSTNGKILEGDNQLINGTIIQNTTLANDMIGAKVDLSLKYNNQDYEVQGAFCNENPPETDRHSSTAACNEWYGDRTRNAVQQTLRCGKTIEWGYIVKPLKPIAVPTTCPFHSTVSLKDENGQVLPINSVNNDIAVHHSFRTSDGRLNEGDRPFVNGIHIEKDGLRPQDIGSVVNLTLKYNKADYEVKGAFCNETPSESDRHSSTATCNEWYGDANQNGVQQTLRCGKTIEWGYIVKSLKPTPTPTTMPPTRIRMKLQQNNMGSNYYQCTVNNDSDTEKTSVGGLTSNGNIKCHGEYTKSTDTLRVYFRIPQDSDLDAGMRLTLNTMRCRNYDPNKECWDRAYPEWALTGENFAMSRGSTMECFWKHPFTSTDRNDVTCKKGSETVAYPTAPPANIATGTIDSVKLEYSYQTKGIINTPGEPQKEGTVTKNDSIYATRNIDGCQLGNSSPDSKCPPGLTCKYTKDANGVINGVSISGNKKTQFISAAWFKGCACNADQAMPGRGICDPVMYRSIPSQSEHQMHNNFCFAPNNQETKITCMFDGNRCNVSEGSISDGICIANTQPQPTSAPAENSCPGKQEKAAPNKCNAACCTPGMDNQCPTGEACNISNGDCLGGSSCGPAADSVCKVAGQSCGPVHYREDCGNGGTRWCHKYQSTCSGVGDASMCIWNGPPNSCCDVCSDGSRDNNTCSGSAPGGGESPTGNKSITVKLRRVINSQITITLKKPNNQTQTAVLNPGATQYTFADLPTPGSYGIVVTSPVTLRVFSCDAPDANGHDCYVNLNNTSKTVEYDLPEAPSTQSITVSLKTPVSDRVALILYKPDGSTANKIISIGETSAVFSDLPYPATYKISVSSTVPLRTSLCAVPSTNQTECYINLTENAKQVQFEPITPQQPQTGSIEVALSAPATVPVDIELRDPNSDQVKYGTIATGERNYTFTNLKYPTIYKISASSTVSLRLITCDSSSTELNVCYVNLNSASKRVEFAIATINKRVNVPIVVNTSFNDGDPKCPDPLPDTIVVKYKIGWNPVRELKLQVDKSTLSKPYSQSFDADVGEKISVHFYIDPATAYTPRYELCPGSISGPNDACEFIANPSPYDNTVIQSITRQCKTTGNFSTADINNDGVVGAGDFFTAIRSFGNTVKIKGQPVKIDATYMSTILSNLGKKAN